MNADRLRKRLIKEWSKALVELVEYEAINEGAWASECDVGEACSEEVLRVLHRIAAAGDIELPNVPQWLKVAWSTFDQRQALAEGWCLMFSDGRGIIEIERDDDANLSPEHGRPAFKYDADAQEYVAKRAAEGSLYHQQALAIVEDQIA